MSEIDSRGSASKIPRGPSENNAWYARLSFAALLATLSACEDDSKETMSNPSLDATNSNSGESGDDQGETTEGEDTVIPEDTSEEGGESTTGTISETTMGTTGAEASTGSEAGSTQPDGTGDTSDSTTESPTEIPGKLDYDEKLKTLLFNGTKVYGPVTDLLNTKFVYEKNSCAANPEKAVQCPHDAKSDTWSCDVNIDMGNKPYRECTITVFATGKELTDDPNEDPLKGPENPRDFEITQ